ncbi:hypothetical protein BD780_003221 [Clostridium tetanomorphum]|uniref:Uncharacterized protein n=1 Tax=Clostridium tetanomorphum TaxID=1553 RepID=A0A923J1V0_CLOTT|nr:hypothetical protein [Clostridium tetanomorphum]KAJ53618.1 hypothetical protein CTM_01509 [Clostridium tetanomorphum DSM 665]MBC2399611.1 hypothetical protein [Clostridium tetanomorphum]MBP1866260.1 hypothetical protein [Clostridium tetanomorphum]NRS85996.1 hypothetical protein [Clostridium tetanomorphum]NRZ95994.1 hypothetical protein [Clostridium tetanomorphum]
MNKKQIIALTTCMCISLNTSVFAKGIQEKKVMAQKYQVGIENTDDEKQLVKMENLVLTENYSKVKITDLKANETEWIEEYVNKDFDGNVSKKIVITDENGDKTFVENKNNNIVISKNNIILHEIPLENLEDPNNYNSKLHSYRSYGSWQGPLITRTHQAIGVGWTAGTLTSIFVAIAFPAATIGTIVATSALSSTISTIIAEQISDVWIELRTYTRVDQANSKYESKRTCYSYRVSNYTDLIGIAGPITWEYDYSGL